MPVRLTEATASASAAALGRAGEDGECSPLEVVRPLRDASLVYGIRFRWMVFDDDPVLPNYDENAWLTRSQDAAAGVPLVVEEFAASRRGLMRMLRAFDDDAWARTGRHETAGRLSLEPYVRHQLAHEGMHLNQLATALA